MNRLVELNGVVLADVEDEMDAQVEKWGEQRHPDGTIDSEESEWQADFDRTLCQEAAGNGTLTWRHILQEEVSEAFAEVDPDKLREELVQIAAVAGSWMRDIDRRTATIRTESLRDFKFAPPAEQTWAGLTFIQDEHGESARG